MDIESEPEYSILYATVKNSSPIILNSIVLYNV